MHRLKKTQSMIDIKSALQEKIDVIPDEEFMSEEEKERMKEFKKHKLWKKLVNMLDSTLLYLTVGKMP